MSVRPAIFYTIAFFILLPLYFWIQPTVKPEGALEEKQESLLKLGGGIDAVAASRQGFLKQFANVRLVIDA